MSADTTPTAVRREHGYGWRVRVDGRDYESGEIAYSTERAAIKAAESYARELAALDPEKRETPPA